METTYKAIQLRDSQDLAAGLGDSYTVKLLHTTIDLEAPAQIGQTIDFGRIPTNARIGRSGIIYDDLSTAGTSKLVIGLVGINNSIAIDDDCLHDNLILNSRSALLIPLDDLDVGLKAWEFMDGLTEDPGGEFMVIGTIKDLATDTTGEMTVYILYTID